MIRRPPRSTRVRSSAASDVYKRQVIIATPWEWHARMAVAAMKAGAYTGIEVPACTTLDEAWDLVNTHEETGVELMFLENACYGREMLAILNMVRENLFGE